MAFKMTFSVTHAGQSCAPPIAVSRFIGARMHFGVCADGTQCQSLIQNVRSPASRGCAALAETCCQHADIGSVASMSEWSRRG